MLSLVDQNHTGTTNKTHSTSVRNKYLQWERCQTLATRAHHQKDFDKATRHFTESLFISKELTQYFFEHYSTNSGISLFYLSSHNLAASLNTQYKALEAKNILFDLHEQLIKVCTDSKMPTKLRLEALSYLDKSLFSLSSQLAYINEVDTIYALLLRTEKIASICSAELLNRLE
jgi:hypothetical protein